MGHALVAISSARKMVTPFAYTKFAELRWQTFQQTTGQNASDAYLLRCAWRQSSPSLLPSCGSVKVACIDLYVYNLSVWRRHAIQVGHVYLPIKFIGMRQK